MANETIYGCVDRADGDKVKFSQDSCTYTGSVIWIEDYPNPDDDYRGMVQVIVNNINCDDTYYGCVDWGNDGKFQITIPDDCCNYYVGGFCGKCFGADETPLYYAVTISGVQNCGVPDTCAGSAVNGYHTLVLDDEPYGCDYLDEAPAIRWIKDTGTIRILLGWNPDGFVISAQCEVDPNRWTALARIEYEGEACDFVSGSGPNEYGEGDCENGQPRAGYDGTVAWSPLVG